MNAERPDLTDADVWAFIRAGCNAREIAAYAGVTLSAAYAMIFHSTHHYARAP